MSTFTEARDDSVGVASRPGGRNEHRARARDANRFLVVLAVVSTAAAAVLGGWLMIDRTSSSGTATTDEVQELIDRYYAAWNDWDGDAYLALVTDDALFEDSAGTTSAAPMAVAIKSLASIDWHVETVGQPVMSGDGPWYVAQANRLTATAFPDDGYDGLTVLTIVDDDGTLRIDHHLYVGES